MQKIVVVEGLIQKRKQKTRETMFVRQIGTRVCNKLDNNNQMCQKLAINTWTHPHIRWLIQKCPDCNICAICGEKTMWKNELCYDCECLTFVKYYPHEYGFHVRYGKKMLHRVATINGRMNEYRGIIFYNHWY